MLRDRDRAIIDNGHPPARRDRLAYVLILDVERPQALDESGVRGEPIEEAIEHDKHAVVGDLSRNHTLTVREARATLIKARAAHIPELAAVIRNEERALKSGLEVQRAGATQAELKRIDVRDIVAVHERERLQFVHPYRSPGQSRSDRSSSVGWARDSILRAVIQTHGAPPDKNSIAEKDGVAWRQGRREVAEAWTNWAHRSGLVKRCARHHPEMPGRRQRPIEPK